MSEKQINVMNNNRNRKMKDSDLNLFIKSLSLDQKKLFMDKIRSHELLWNHDLTINERRKRFDNFRYTNVSRPSEFNAILIYLTALCIVPSLKLEVLFPGMHNQEYKNLLIHLSAFSIKSNNWNRCEAYKK